MLVLAVLVLLLLVFFGFDAVTLLHLAESERVGHEGLVCRLLLLLDSEKGVLTNLRGGVAKSVGVLRGNEVLVGSTDLCTLSGWAT